jgi:antitoxin PrlF
MRKMVRRLTEIDMIIAFSKVTSKNQTVIPREVREQLGLRPGDRLRYTVTSKGVKVERAKRGLEDDPFVVFTEWASEEDEKAFGSL